MVEEKKEEGEKKQNEEKKEEKPSEESKEQKEASPPEEFVYRVFMHCEGCARKIKKSLRGFHGVEDVITHCKANKVVVKGKTADPLKVLDRIQQKRHGKVELLTQLPKPPAEDAKKPEEEEKEKPKNEEQKEEPKVIVVTLKVHMHCGACAQGIKKTILRMKGVESANPDLKSSEVAVKGKFDPEELVEYLYKKTEKQAVIVKQEEPEKKEEEKQKEGGEADKEGDQETKVEVKKNEFYSYHPKYDAEYYYMFPFSDENPNACSVM